MDSITFKKSDMTFITDDDLTVIKLALIRYHKALKKGKLKYQEYLINVQLISAERMIEFFEDNAGFLAVPYFPIDENE